MEKIFSVAFRRLCRAVALGLLIVSIVTIVVEHKPSSTMSSVNNLDENLKQNVMPRIWSLSVCCSVGKFFKYEIHFSKSLIYRMPYLKPSYDISTLYGKLPNRLPTKLAPLVLLK